MSPSPQSPLKNKTALVTGGSRGLGRAMVERFIRDGARVFFTYRSDETAASSLAKTIGNNGGEAHALQCDLSSTDSIFPLFQRIDQLLADSPGDPKLDILVANAGTIHTGPIENVKVSDFDAVFDLNVKGVFFLIQEALQRLRDGGRIITLGSGLTRFVMPELVTYSASKGAIDSLTKVLAQHLGSRGITVNTLAPGAIDTDMNPWLKSPEGIAAMSDVTALNRVGHASDIADVAAFLASDDSRWVTGQRLEASGGQRL